MLNDREPLSLGAEREAWLDQLIADPTMKPAYFRVAWAIACHMNRNKNGWAWPGINRIAKKAGVDRSTAIRASNWMEARGHLRIVRTRRGELNDPNSYRPIVKARDGGGSRATPNGPQATRVVAPTPPEPVIEPVITAGSDNPSDRNSWEKLLGILGTSSDDLKWINQRHRLNQWLADGFDLDLDILPTISRLLDAARQRGKTISSLKYFDNAIAEARAERLSPPRTIAPRTNNGKRKSYTPRDYVDQLLQQSTSKQGTSDGVPENPLRLLQDGTRR